MRRPLLALLLVGCTDGPTDSEPIQAGVARARIPAPVGIGTAGFGPFGAPSYPTPFNSIYPGTRRIHGHPEIKVVTLSRGEGHEAVFVRLDAVGVFHQLRTDIVKRASERLGRDLDHALILGATHTHSGPGRVVNTGQDGSSFFDIIAGKFFPEFYEAFVETVVDAIVASFDDLAPARLAAVDAVCDDGHEDRRCEDGEYQNGSLPVFAVERGGQVDAVVMAYAIHGTLFGISEGYLTQDVHGAIEEAVEDRFDHPVEALLFNSWGADMAPGSPAAPLVPSFYSGSKFQRARAIGRTVADSVVAALADAEYVDAPEIELETHRFVVNRETIGYADDEWVDVNGQPYRWGAVYCEGGAECEPPLVVDEHITDHCIPFTESLPAPSVTLVTVGRIGEHAVVTFPGEPGTVLAESIMEGIAERHGAERFLFVGYAQDYLGYSIDEESWWYGGYEASGALWGPRQGAFIAARIGDAYDAWATGACPGDEPGPLEPFPYSLDDVYTPEGALDAGTVAEQPGGPFGAEDLVTFTVYGDDPWVGAPLAWIESPDGAPLLRPNGVRIDSDDHNFEVDLLPDPSYVDLPRGDRHFAWRFSVPVTQPVEGEGVSLPAGEWVFRVRIPRADGSVDEVTSEPFTVLPADG